MHETGTSTTRTNCPLDSSPDELNLDPGDVELLPATFNGIEPWAGVIPVDVTDQALRLEPSEPNSVRNRARPSGLEREKTNDLLLGVDHSVQNVLLTFPSAWTSFGGASLESFGHLFNYKTQTN